MVQPRGRFPGTGSFGHGLYEGFETYLGGGSSSHGYGAAEFNIASRDIVPHVAVDVSTMPEHLGYRTYYPGVGAVEPVPALHPRRPHSPSLDAAPTPVPSTDVVDPFPPGRGAPSAPPPSGAAKKASKKKPSTSEPSVYGRIHVFHKGRSVSYG